MKDSKQHLQIPVVVFLTLSEPTEWIIIEIAKAVENLLLNFSYVHFAEKHEAVNACVWADGA